MSQLHRLTGYGLALVVLLVACAAPIPQPGSTTPMPKHLTEQANGTTINLQAGEHLDLSLTANPTTGYQWEVAALDRAVVNIVGEPVYTADNQLPGSGGTQTYQLVAVAAGQTTLQLIYHRPFEANTPPVKTVDVTFSVK